MSSISSGPEQISLPTQPTADKASAVQSKITSQIGKISDITAEISAIMKELQALEPPSQPGKDADEDAMKKYQESLKSFQQQVASLNKKLDSLQTKLQRAKGELNKLNNVELPQAERQDAAALRDWAEKSQEALERQTEATASSTEDSEDLTDTAAQGKVRLAKTVVKKQIELSDGAKIDVSMAQLRVQIGDMAGKPGVAKPEVTTVPKTPATGI